MGSLSIRLNWIIALVVVVITPLSLFTASFIAKKTFHMFKEQSVARGEQTAFVNEMCSRPSCEKCNFKSENRASDITMFDCKEYTILTGKADDDKGYTAVFVHTNKGQQLLDRIKVLHSDNDNSLFDYREIPEEDAAKDMSEEEQFALLATDGMLVKRPLLITDNKILVGFKIADWSEIV